MITNFSPNTTLKDILIAVSTLLKPYTWQNGDTPTKVEKKLESYLGVKDGIISFDSGRTALYKALKAFGIGKGDEVMIQAFTCVVVANAVLYTGATPIYVDIKPNNYNVDPAKLESKITKKTKAIIIQHTFGLVADIEAILKIAKKHNLKVIEDCAHSLGAEYKKQKLGTFADAAIFSFGVDKVISSVRGGALLLKNKSLYKKLRAEKLPALPKSIIFKHLLHPIIFAIGKKLYGFFSLGKILLYLSKKLKITARVIENSEKRCQKVAWFPAQMPNALAKIALNQLKHLDDFNHHRQAIATFYKQNLANQYKKPEILPNSNPIYLRYPLQTKNRSKIITKAKSAGVFLGDWYDTIVAPKDVDLKLTKYHKGLCPEAEKVCAQVLNLPTHRGINLSKAKKIVDLLS